MSMEWAVQIGTRRTFCFALATNSGRRVAFELPRSREPSGAVSANEYVSLVYLSQDTSSSVKDGVVLVCQPANLREVLSARATRPIDVRAHHAVATFELPVSLPWPCARARDAERSVGRTREPLEIMGGGRGKGERMLPGATSRQGFYRHGVSGSSSANRPRPLPCDGDGQAV